MYRNTGELKCQCTPLLMKGLKKFTEGSKQILHLMVFLPHTFMCEDCLSLQTGGSHLKICQSVTVTVRNGHRSCLTVSTVYSIYKQRYHLAWLSSMDRILTHNFFRVIKKHSFFFFQMMRNSEPLQAECRRLQRENHVDFFV